MADGGKSPRHYLLIFLTVDFCWLIFFSLWGYLCAKILAATVSIIHQVSNKLTYLRIVYISTRVLIVLVPMFVHAGCWQKKNMTQHCRLTQMVKKANLAVCWADMSLTCRPTHHFGPLGANTDIRHYQLRLSPPPLPLPPLPLLPLPPPMPLPNTVPQQLPLPLPQ
jgi:hypothetical protein